MPGPVRRRQGGGEGCHRVQRGCRCRSSRRGIQAVEVSRRLWRPLAAAELETKIIAPVVRQPLELQYFEVEVQQRRLAVQAAPAPATISSPALAAEIRQRLQQVRRQLRPAVVIRLLPVLTLQCQQDRLILSSAAPRPAGLPCAPPSGLPWPGSPGTCVGPAPAGCGPHPATPSSACRPAASRLPRVAVRLYT